MAPTSAFGISALMMLIFACCYKRKVVDKLHDVPETRGPPHEELSIWACFFDRATCLHTCFCMPSVAAKNYSVTGVCSYLPSYFLVAIGTYSCLYPIMAAIRAWFSVKLRRRMNMETNYCLELCLSCFCFPLEVGRESLEVDEELDVQIGVCLNIVEGEGDDTELEDMTQEINNAKSKVQGQSRELAAGAAASIPIVGKNKQNSR